MARILVQTKRRATRGVGSKIGGRPDAPRGFERPRCGQCGGTMQFLAQVVVPPGGTVQQQQLLLLFQCQNRPGLCDEWEPASGGNAALLVPVSEELEVAAPPVADERTLLPREDLVEE